MGDLKADERTEGVARSWKHVSEKLHKLWKLSHGHLRLWRVFVTALWMY
jgi:hypothetical protein